MTSRTRGNKLVVALAALTLTLAGPLPADEGGAASIEELVEQCKGMKSLASLVPMVHPDDRATLGFGILMMGTMAPLMAMPSEINSENEDKVNTRSNQLIAEFEALEEKHGLQKAPEDAPSVDTPEGMAMHARYVFDGVDLPAFISDVENWMVSSLGEEAMGGDFAPDFSQLENLQIDGDSATATVEGKPIEFIRDGGRWYLRIEM